MKRSEKKVMYKSIGKQSKARRDSNFISLSVVIPLINEVKSFHQVADCIFEHAGKNIQELIIVVCHKTTDESLAATKALEKKYPGQIRIVWQKLPCLGGALREGFLAACGSHVVVMFSDGEADPRIIGNLVQEAKANPDMIISASRWLEEKSFRGYPLTKMILNYLFQKTFSILYWKKITDFTFGYRLYPIGLIRGIAWEETGHSFVLESILKPLRLEVDVLEMACSWKARSEGKSQLKPYMYLRYLWVGLKVRVIRRGYFVK